MRDQSVFATRPWLGHEPSLRFSCLIIHMKSLVQNIPQALAALVSRAVMLRRVFYESRSFPQHRRALLNMRGTVSLHERLGLSSPSEAGWLGQHIVSGGKTGTGFSPGRKCIMTRVYQALPSEVGERKRSWFFAEEVNYESHHR